jgi:GNAT superfamily N-acetyltransferase
LLAASDPSSLTLLACDARGRVVGFLSGGRERSGQLERDGEIYAIYLLHEVQRNGVGSRLVRRFARELRAQGLNSMAVWVLALNPFRRFYEALGGQLICEKEIERGGKSFIEVAYGWSDLSALRGTVTNPQPQSMG